MYTLLIILLIWAGIINYTIFLHVVYRKFFTQDFRTAKKLKDFRFPDDNIREGYFICDVLTVIPFTLPFMSIIMTCVVIYEIYGNIDIEIKPKDLPFKIKKFDEQYKNRN